MYLLVRCSAAKAQRCEQMWTKASTAFESSPAKHGLSVKREGAYKPQPPRDLFN